MNAIVVTTMQHCNEVTAFQSSSQMLQMYVRISLSTVFLDPVCLNANCLGSCDASTSLNMIRKYNTRGLHTTAFVLQPTHHRLLTLN